MTLNEYKSAQKDLYTKYCLSTKVLDKKCAESNNPYKVGDIIEDNYHIIRIVGWKMHYGFIEELPTLTYIGVELKKDLTPKKKQRNTEMWQHNVRRKLN